MQRNKKKEKIKLVENEKHDKSRLFGKWSEKLNCAFIVMFMFSIQFRIFNENSGIVFVVCKWMLEKSRNMQTKLLMKTFFRSKFESEIDFCS